MHVWDKWGNSNIERIADLQAHVSRFELVDWLFLINSTCKCRRRGSVEL